MNIAKNATPRSGNKLRDRVRTGSFKYLKKYAMKMSYIGELCEIRALSLCKRARKLKRKQWQVYSASQRSITTLARSRPTSEGNLILRSPMMVVIRRGNTRYFGFVREGIKISVKIDAVRILRSLRDRRPALRSADCFL